MCLLYVVMFAIRSVACKPMLPVSLECPSIFKRVLVHIKHKFFPRPMCTFVYLIFSAGIYTLSSKKQRKRVRTFANTNKK